MFKFIIVTEMFIQGLGVIPMVTTEAGGKPTTFDTKEVCLVAAQQVEKQMPSVLNATCVYYLETK